MGKFETWQDKASELDAIMRPPGAPKVRGPSSTIAPDFAQDLRTFVLGGVMGRPGLDLRTRLLCTIAAVTVLGKEPILKHYAGVALNAGCTKEEVAEVVAQMAVYGGAPCAMIGLAAVEQAWREIGR
ncbi:MAG: carboxymuconolactone decarboxylase family protein [Dehalococcoidia bacterium]|nr:carboxymuconolactone decarboxylase family protein [Dehalococcoidia bacterium]